jgi:hypothetical protein
MSVEYVSKKTVRWYLTILFVVTMCVPLLFAYRGEARDNQIAKNTAALQTGMRTQCLNMNIAATNTNLVLTTLIQAVSGTSSIGAAERSSRVKKYQDALVPMTNCG